MTPGNRSTSSEVLLDSPELGVCRITLNRPERLNAMNGQLVQQLHQALDEVATDNACRVVILTGAGRGFCAGLDLNGYGNVPGSATSGRVQGRFEAQQHLASLVPHFREVPQPIIAAVNGPASGGGLALVLAADVRIAAQSARFNVAFIRIGFSACDLGTSWTLPRLIGLGRAHEMMLTGRMVDSEEAERIGLVLSVVPDDILIERALQEASLIMQNSPMGVRMTKEVMWSASEIPSLRSVIDLENRTQIMLSETRDTSEAKRAFLEKRAPQFVNE
jgi:enoyl-CoA hydratase